MARGEIKALVFADGVAVTAGTPSPLQGTYLELTEMAAPSTPASGYTRVYPDTQGKLHTLNDAGVDTVVGAGGSGELTVVDNPDDANAGWAASAAGVTVATGSSAAVLPLSGIIETSIVITPVSGTDYARYRWTMPASMKNMPHVVKWWQRCHASYATGDFKLEVYTNSASNYSGSYVELALTGDVSGTSSIPFGNGPYKNRFDATDLDYYELRIVRTAGTSPIYLANVIVGPGVSGTGAAVGPWAAFTATLTNGTSTPGTNTQANFWRRVGENLEVMFEYAQTATGTDGTGTYLLTLPTSLVADLDKYVLEGATAQGIGHCSGSWGGAVYHGHVLLNTSTTVAFMLGNETTTPTAWASTHGGFADNAATRVTGQFSVPIAAWIGSGVLSVMQDETLTEWQAWTPTGAWTANTTYTGAWRRNGDTMQGWVKIAIAGAPTSATLTVNLPTGYTIDTTKVDADADNTALGIVNVRDDGTGAYKGSVAYVSTTAIQPVWWSLSTLRLDTTAITQASPITFAASDEVHLSFSVPILEWRGKSVGAVGFANATAVNAGLVTKQAVGSQATTFAGNLGGSASASFTVKYQRIGDWVTLEIPALAVTPASSSTKLVSATAIADTWARPAGTRSCAVTEVINNATLTTLVGMCRVLSTGVLEIYRDPSATAFANAGAGTNSATTITYYVGS